MGEGNSFRDLIRRLRAGDQDAATELVRQYEPEIRRAVRVRLADSHLGRLLDSLDICQSVLANFFARVALGQFELNDPRQLLQLLVTMARNKLTDVIRKQQAGRRDHRTHAAPGWQPLETIPDPGPGPSQIVACQELFQALHSQLTEPERYLIDQRLLGRDWADIAAEVGGSPDALRKRLARAIDRATQHLGLNEANHDD